MQLPEVSEKAVAVIVPIYNRLDLLRATIESLRSQTLESAEFILVDDRSDEQVWRYLQELPLEDSRFSVLRKPDAIPRGCQSSRNIGLDAATADSVVFLDSDDLLAPRCLETRYAILKSDSSAEIVVGRQAIMSDDAGPQCWVNVRKTNELDLDRFLRLSQPLDVPWINGGVLIRRKALTGNAIRWRPEFHWDDVVFHFECLLAGMRVRWMSFADSADSYYRHHSGSRYGEVLATREGLENSTTMLCWARRSLDGARMTTPGRARDLAISFFHACVLRAIDSRDYVLTNRLVNMATASGLITSVDSASFKRFGSGRKLLGFSPRASYYWDQLARRSYLKEFFRTDDSTYGTVPCTRTTTPSAITPDFQNATPSPVAALNSEAR